jgi:hypothetical protein
MDSRGKSRQYSLNIMFENGCFPSSFVLYMLVSTLTGIVSDGVLRAKAHLRLVIGEISTCTCLSRK